MNFVNAKLIILKDQTYQEDYTVDVMFNPAEYTFSQTAKFTNPDQGQPVFSDFQFDPFTVTLLYDTYTTDKSLDEKEDVRTKYTDKIASLLKPSQAAQSTRHQPMCIFSWGSFNLKGKIQKVDQKFTMFLPNGIPVRATVTMIILPTATNKEVKELLGKEACRKLWTVKNGDRLDLIANQALKDPAQWRKIAEANKIINPLAFPAKADIGKVIVIPDL